MVFNELPPHGDDGHARVQWDMGRSVQCVCGLQFIWRHGGWVPMTSQEASMLVQVENLRREATALETAVFRGPELATRSRP